MSRGCRIGHSPPLCPGHACPDLQGIHISEIISGYEKAAEYAMRTMPGASTRGASAARPPLTQSSRTELVCRTIEDVTDAAQLQQAVLPVMTAKQYGYHKALADVVSLACAKAMVVRRRERLRRSARRRSPPTRDTRNPTPRTRRRPELVCP